MEVISNLINHQQDIDKIYLYAKDPYEPKYQLLLKKCNDAGIKHYDDPKAFMAYSNTTDDTCDNIHRNNPNNSRKKLILIFFNDMIADMNTNKKNSIFNQITLYQRQKTGKEKKKNLFSCPKISQIKFYKLPNNEDSQ